MRPGRKEMSLLPSRKVRRAGTTGHSVLPQIPTQVMYQILLEAISKHMKWKMVTGSSEHGFTKGKTCLTNLITFRDKMPLLVDRGEGIGCCLL